MLEFSSMKYYLHVLYISHGFLLFISLSPVAPVLSEDIYADLARESTTKNLQSDERRVKQYTGESADVSRLLDTLLLGYDKRLRPDYKGGPVNVSITIFVSSVSSVSEVNMDFTLDFYFRQYWRDSRLNFSDSEPELCISNEMLGRIWWPDTFFATAKLARFHTATTHNAFLRIKPDGFITQSLRLTVTSSCPMDLTYFPMDVQTCNLEIESYAYSVSHIIYSWKDGLQDSVKMEKSLQLPQFSVIGYGAMTKTEVLTTGYYIIHIYIPSCLIVVLSWISFWLHREASPARVALGITTVLTMTTLISNTNESLPKISYLKSIDIYLVTCFFMVFASLLEYASVSYLGNYKSFRAPLNTTRRLSPDCNTDVKSWRIHPASLTTRSLERPSDKVREFKVNHRDLKVNHRDLSVNNGVTHRRNNDNRARDFVNKDSAPDRFKAVITGETSSHDVMTSYNHASSRSTGYCNSSLIHRTGHEQSVYLARLIRESDHPGSNPYKSCSNPDNVTHDRNDSHRIRESCDCESFTYPSHNTDVEDGLLSENRISFKPQGDVTASRSNNQSTEHLHYSNQHITSSPIENTQYGKNCGEDFRSHHDSQNADKIKLGVHLACAIDRYSRVLFPVVFTGFNIVYWAVYLNISQTFTVEEDFVPFNSD